MILLSCLCLISFYTFVAEVSVLGVVTWSTGIQVLGLVHIQLGKCWLKRNQDCWQVSHDNKLIYGLDVRVHSNFCFLSIKDYVYHTLAAKASGELCLKYIFSFGAFARMPLLLRFGDHSLPIVRLQFIFNWLAVLLRKYIQIFYEWYCLQEFNNHVLLRNILYLWWLMIQGQYRLLLETC